MREIKTEVEDKENRFIGNGFVSVGILSGLCWDWINVWASASA